MDILAILGNPLVVGVGTATTGGLVSWQALKYREGRLEKDLDAARSQVQQQRGQIEQLEKTVATTADGASKPVAWRSAIVSILNELTERSGAERATLYVPVENRRGLMVGVPSSVWALAPRKTTSRSAVPATDTGLPEPSWTSWST